MRDEHLSRSEDFGMHTILTITGLKNKAKTIQAARRDPLTTHYSQLTIHDSNTNIAASYPSAILPS